MKYLVILLMLALSVTANAQNRSHSSRSADQPDQNRQERREDGHRPPDRGPHDQPPMMVATPEQVMLMVEQLNKISFSREQVDFAIFCVKILPVPAEGIRRLASAMQYDSSKLEFLKEAYRFCPDTHNYKIVEDAFSFKSSVDELRSYINREYKVKYY